MRLREIKRFVVAAVAVAAITSIAFLNGNASAAAAVYKDYSQVPSVLDEEFAKARIYYTDETVITVKQVGRDSETARVIGRAVNGSLSLDNTGFHIDEGRELVILIEGSTAKDIEGNPIDVIWRLNNYRPFTGVTIASTGEDVTDQRDHMASFALRMTNCGSTVALPTEQDCLDNTVRLGIDDPIVFWVNVNYAFIDFTVEYIKKGTYNETTTHGTPDGVSKTAFMSYDYDVINPNYNVASDPYFNGREGIRVNPNNSNTTYYYHKNFETTDSHLLESDNGLHVESIAHDASFNGIYWGGSFFATAEDLSDSKFTFTYSAGPAGTCLFFGSPVGYETPTPIKLINANRPYINVKPGETFKYVINQYVPETYSTSNDVLTYASLWAKYDNINQDHNYDKLVITDTLDSHLNVPAASAVTVYNGNTNVTNNFTITVSGQTITATAKSDYLTSPLLYGSNIKLSFSTSVKDPTDVESLTNNAKTTYSYTGLPDIERTSPDVVTYIQHTLTIKHLDKDTGEEIVDTVARNYDHGYRYETDPLDELPEGYELVETPENADGTLEKDETVIYYYKKLKNPNTAGVNILPFTGIFAGAGIIATGLYIAISKRR